MASNDWAGRMMDRHAARIARNAHAYVAGTEVDLRSVAPGHRGAQDVLCATCGAARGYQAHR
jgi:hypothetical protein